MEPAEPVTLPCSQAKLGRGVRASAGHCWAPPPATASRALLQPRPTPSASFCAAAVLSGSGCCFAFC